MQSATEDPHTTDAASIEGDAEKVWLSFINGQQSKPTLLLRIPHDILITLSTKPRKWLCYAAYVICGTAGTLHFLDEHGGLSCVDREGVVNPGDHFVYRLAGVPKFVDPSASQQRVNSPPKVVLDGIREYYGGCPFTHLPLEFCQCCRLIPHSTVLRVILRSRANPVEDMSTNDPGNMIMLNVMLLAYFDKEKSIAFLATPNAFLKSNELPGKETEDPDKYLVTLHAFKRLPPVHIPHGKSSDMTQNSGLENPPPERHLIQNNLPKNMLLDVCYAVALLAQWGSEHAKLILDKSAKKYYPCGGIRRGEAQEGDTRREERIRERKRGNIDRGDRAAILYRNSPTTDDGTDRLANGHLTKRDDRILDSLLWAPYIFRDISPEEVEAKREEERKDVKQEEAERIGRWLEEVYEPTSEDGVGCGEETEDGCPLPEADDWK